ncbi:hypothetical protein TNCV_3106371 [Trichonephila clavipes]|nr:hypothetical protein TNCV_3106371 [Trichonephila clavipes]
MRRVSAKFVSCLLKDNEKICSEVTKERKLRECLPRLEECEAQNDPNVFKKLILGPAATSTIPIEGSIEPVENSKLPLLKNYRTVLSCSQSVGALTILWRG